MVLDLVKELQLKYDVESVISNLKVLFQLNNFKCFIAENKYPVGCAAFIVAPEIWNKVKLVAYESFWYVKPEHRKGIGMGLVKFVEKNIEADIIEFGIADKRLGEAMRRNGYNDKKTLMQKEI